jgi:hypothetical protein
VTDAAASGSGDDPAGQNAPHDVRDAYAAARELRDEAETEAAEIRRSAEATADVTTAEANRYAAKRLQEVELLVGKAKRGLTAAEERARLIVDTARSEAEKLLLAAREQARQVAAGAEPQPSSGKRSQRARSEADDAAAADLASELDRMLSEAMAKALDLPRDDPYPRRGPGRR